MLPKAGVSKNGRPGPGTYLVRLGEEIVEGCWLAGMVLGNTSTERARKPSVAGRGRRRRPSRAGTSVSERYATYEEVLAAFTTTG
jgi:hypothetical protein